PTRSPGDLARTATRVVVPQRYFVISTDEAMEDRYELHTIASHHRILGRTCVCRVAIPENPRGDTCESRHATRRRTAAPDDDRGKGDAAVVCHAAATPRPRRVDARPG